MSVNPFGGPGDDIYRENGAELRLPKAFVNLVDGDDIAVRTAQTDAAFQFVAALAGVPVNDARDETDGVPVQFIGSESGENRLGTTYHESGTLWMGEDYTSSVTDSQGRFHHVSNAYATDQSIFPSIGSANPINTGMALTRMIAPGIMSRFASSPVAALEAGFQRLLSNDSTVDSWRYVGPLFDSAIPFSMCRTGPVIGAGKDGVHHVGYRIKSAYGPGPLGLVSSALLIYVSPSRRVHSQGDVGLDSSLMRQNESSN
jgi:hypothetical protein